jgi:hypothetical protein
LRFFPRRYDYQGTVLNTYNMTMVITSITVTQQSSNKNSIVINNKYFSWAAKTRENFKTRFLAESFRNITYFSVLKYAKLHVIN